MPKSSQTKAPVKGSDYALTFAKKASNVNLLMEKGADVKFEGDVDNINAEYVSSGSGKCIELIIQLNKLGWECHTRDLS